VPIAAIESRMRLSCATLLASTERPRDALRVRVLERAYAAAVHCNVRMVGGYGVLWCRCPEYTDPEPRHRHSFGDDFVILRAEPV
jgi:hypothetical protein